MQVCCRKWSLILFCGKFKYTKIKDFSAKKKSNVAHWRKKIISSLTDQNIRETEKNKIKKSKPIIIFKKARTVSTPMRIFLISPVNISPHEYFLPISFNSSSSSKKKLNLKVQRNKNQIMTMS